MFQSIDEAAVAFTLAEPPLPCVPSGTPAPSFLYALDAALTAAHQRGDLRLPDFSRCEAVGVFSDYSDKSTGQGDYNTYTLVLVNLGALSGVSSDVKVVRLRHGLSVDHELSFKGLHHGPTQRALPDLIDCAERLPGLVVSVLVSRKVPSLFAPSRAGARQFIIDAGFDGIPQPVAEATLRVTHLAAYFIRLLCSRHHKLFWMSDRDDMLANPRRAGQFWSLANRAIHALSPDSFPIVGFAQEFAERTPEFDLQFVLSVADLFAGATGPALTSLTSTTPVTFRNAAIPIVQALGRESLFLKKLTLTVGFGRGQTAQVGLVSWIPQQQVGAADSNAVPSRGG